MQKIPDIGKGLARVISNFVLTGRSNVLDWLQGEVPARKLYALVPGIGETLAERIANQLNTNKEQAAYDSRLADIIEGFGPRRIQNVRATLSGMLNQTAQRRAWHRAWGQNVERKEQPEVGTLLNVDTDYRRKAQAHELDKTQDWVVVYYERDSEEGQVTVVTATRGPLKGKRIVRGRETECKRYYGQ